MPLLGQEVQVWNFFINNKCLDSRHLLIENIIIWSVLYLPFQWFLYSKMTRGMVKGYKFNPKYPLVGLMLKEFIRSIRGVYICSVFESLVHRVIYHETEHVSNGIFASLQPEGLEGQELEVVYVIVGGIILYLWGDAHFYFSHRLLHTKWLYKNVHKYHHESYNPTPFSGLSMHWFESMVYFSAAPMLAMAGVPLWLFRLMSKGLIIFPLEGHTGYGTWNVETSYNHYIHHAKFDYNYGSSPLWDHILGTEYDMQAKMSKKLSLEDKRRQQSAEEQAKLVGIDLDLTKEN